MQIHFTKQWAATALALPTCLFSSLALAAPLTEAEALRLSLAQPSLQELARTRLAAAEADVSETKTWANPSLEFSREKTGVTRESAWQLTQTLDLSGRRGWQQEAARLRLEATSAETQTWRLEHSTEVRRAFYALLHQQLSLAATEAWRARFARIGQIVSKLNRAGEVSGYDHRRLLREQHSAEAKTAEARAHLERRRETLAALIGQPYPAEGVAGQLLPEPPAGLTNLQTRLQQSPVLAALAARAEAASADNTASQALLPELTVGIGRKQSDDGIKQETGPSVMLSMPLPVFDRQQAKQLRSAAQASAARAEYVLLKQKAEGELNGLHRQLTQLQFAAERFRREAVTPSNDLIRIAESSYRAGESSVLELLDAYKGVLETELSALDLEWKARETRIELDQLTGNQAP